MKGDQDDPFTHDDLTGARGYKWCRCHQCGVEAVCTPRFDFYGDCKVGSPLRCEACLCGVSGRVNSHSTGGVA